VGRTLTRIGNRLGAWSYRRFDGRFASGRADVLVLLLDVRGRRTGLPRPTCVRYLETPEGLVVWGTGSGSPRDPDWFRNLRAADEVDVQIRDEHVRMRARELLGPERDAMWRDTILARAPQVATYAARAGRTIPVALLSR
jgi:deazaflavin-dependent oxidoreductase (nitroreductase family)